MVFRKLVDLCQRTSTKKVIFNGYLKVLKMIIKFMEVKYSNVCIEIKIKAKYLLKNIINIFIAGTIPMDVTAAIAVKTFKICQ